MNIIIIIIILIKNLISDLNNDKLLNDLINLELRYPEYFDENSPQIELWWIIR